MINFDILPYIGCEIQYISETIKTHEICSYGKFTHLYDEWRG